MSKNFEQLSTITTVTPSARTAVAPSRVNHYYNIHDAEFAAQLGLQVRSICGVWIFPGRRSVLLSTRGFRRRDCKRCMVSFARRMRAAEKREETR